MFWLFDVELQFDNKTCPLLSQVPSIVILCLMPDDFTRQLGRAFRREWVMVTGAICPTLFLNTKITSLLFYFNTRREGASRRDRINLIRRLVALQLQMLMFDGNFCTVPTFVMKEKCHFQMHCLTLLFRCTFSHSWLGLRRCFGS